MARVEAPAGARWRTPTAAGTDVLKTFRSSSAMKLSISPLEPSTWMPSHAFPRVPVKRFGKIRRQAGPCALATKLVAVGQGQAGEDRLARVPGVTAQYRRLHRVDRSVEGLVARGKWPQVGSGQEQRHLWPPASAPLTEGGLKVS